MSFVGATTSFKSIDEVNAHVEHILSLKVRISDELKLSLWFPIASLYHSVGADQHAEKYLREYLTVKRGSDPEANYLLGNICKKHKKYELALKHYEKFLQCGDVTHASFLEAAELCLNCAQNIQDEKSCIELAVKGLDLLRKFRRLNERKYSMPAIGILVSLYDLLITKTSITYWIDEKENIRHLFKADETYTSGRLHVLILRALLRKRDFQRAWVHVWKHRITFANNLEWNLFIKEDFDQLKLGIPIKSQDNNEENNDEPFELYLFALYNHLRISRLSSPSNYSHTSINEFRENIKTHDLPPECNTVSVIERWKKIKSEYDSLGCLHNGMVCLSRAPKNLDFLLPTSNKWESKSSYKEALRSSCMSLRMCLSYNNNPNTPDSSLLDSNHMRMLIYQRQSDAAHMLLTLLRCFELSYLNANWDATYDVREITANKYGMPRSRVLRKETQEESEGFDVSYDVSMVVNVKTAFCFPRISGVIREMGSERGFLSMDISNWFVDELETVDKVAFQSRCFDLENIIELAAWYVENGKLRIWLREIFHVVNLPKVSELEQLAQKNPDLTIMDLESFLLLLLVQRHIKCVVRGGANTMGQILYLSGQREVWRVPEGAKKFWRSCLCLWGSDHPQKRYYANDIMTKDEIAQSIREIRGSFLHSPYSANTFRAHQHLYLALGIVYQNLIERNGLDCSVEIRHYYYVYKSWNKITSTETITNENGKAKDKLKFLVFDDDISEEEYRSVIQIAPSHLENIINSLQLPNILIQENLDMQFEALPTISINSYSSQRVENILNQPNTRYAFATSPLPSSMETPGSSTQRSPSSPVSPGIIQLNLDYFSIPEDEEAVPDVSMDQLGYHMMDRHDSDIRSIPDMEWSDDDRGDEESGEMDGNIIPAPTRSMFDNDHTLELKIDPQKPDTPCSSVGSNYSGHSRRSSVTNPFTDTLSKSQWSPISSPLSESSFRLPAPILSEDSPTVERGPQQFEYSDRIKTLIPIDDRKKSFNAGWKDKGEEEQSETASVMSMGFSDDDRSVVSWGSASTGSTSVSSRLSRQLRKLDAARSPRETSIRLLRSP